MVIGKYVVRLPLLFNCILSRTVALVVLDVCLIKIQICCWQSTTDPAVIRGITCFSCVSLNIREIFLLCQSYTSY